MLTVVVPCFNEAEVLPETARRLETLLDGLVDAGRVAAGSHALFVDDGSMDRTWPIIRGLRAGSPRFGGLRLSRNRGHQVALLAGLLAAPGDAVVSVDADLQDDLGTIQAMLDAWAGGADLVFGVRRTRASDTWAKRATAHAFYRLMHGLGAEVVFDHADFRLLSRRALEALREYGEANLFLRALVVQLGFRSEIVPYDRAERFAGRSKYPWWRMLSLAVDGVTSFTTRPLRIITALGCTMSALSLAATAWALGVWLVRASIPGWASTVVPIYLACGVQLLCMGVVGEYVGRIYVETKRRPRFHVAETLAPATLPAAGDAVMPDGPVRMRV